MTEAEILARYRLEPRAQGRPSSYGVNYWLIVIDKTSGKAVCDPDNPRKHKRFKDSDEAIAWMKKNLA